MTDNKSLLLAGDLRYELVNHILPFWMENMQDREHGGFYGQMDGENRINPQADKGGILNARILDLFSSIPVPPTETIPGYSPQGKGLYLYFLL